MDAKLILEELMAEPTIQIDDTTNWPLYFSEAWAFFVDRGSMLQLMLNEIMFDRLEATTFRDNSEYKTVTFSNGLEVDYYGKVDGEDITKWKVNKVTIDFVKISNIAANDLTLTFEGKFTFGDDFLISNDSTFSIITINDPNSILSPDNFAEINSSTDTIYGGLTSWSFFKPIQNILDPEEPIKLLSRSISNNIIGTCEFNSAGKVTTLTRVDNGNTVLKLSNYDSVNPDDYMNFDKITDMLLENNIIRPVDKNKAVHIDAKSGDDYLYGSDVDDTLEGGSGNDVVNAGAGEDLIIGGNGAGNDIYDGGKGVDVVKYTSAQAGIKIDLSGKKNNAYSYAIVDGKVVIDNFDSSHTGVDTLKNIENIIAGNYDDILIGSKSSNDISGGDGNDSISGLDGNDTLNGGNGSDILNGGKGADSMAGGADDDTYYIDNKSDVIVEGENAGEDLVYASISYTLGNNSNIENITLIGSAALGIGNELENEITGNSKNNTLSGNAGDDTINGGAGNDVITGGYGSDTLTGGAGKDKFVFDNSPDGIDVDTITDFATQSDKLVFDNDAFSGLLTANGKFANKAGVVLDAGDLLIGDVNETSSTGQHLLYNNTNGNLYYDADGTGGDSAVLVATLDGVPTIQIKDILIID